MCNRFFNQPCAWKHQFFKKHPSYLVAMLLVLSTTASHGYEVWMGTHRMSSQLATDPITWARTAAWVDGVNYNRAPSGTFPATNAQRDDVIRRINHVENTLVGVPRSAVTRTSVDEASRAAIATSIENTLRTARGDGASLNEFMLYDERHNDTLYTWTEAELQIYREELDKQGQQNARILWRATNNAVRNLNFASLPIIDGLLIEASADRFINNHFNVNTLAQSFWNRSATSDKELYLQIPRSENSQTQYEATREAVLEMTNVLGVDGVRSDRLVVLPVTYGDNIDQLPETINNGTAYPNTMPGIILSLIEQRPYFEGRLGDLPENFAASTERFEPEASIAPATDGSLRRNKSTNAVDGANLGFVVNNGSLEVGQTGNVPYDRAAVIPFQLPNFGDIDNPFLSAHFEGFLTSTVTLDGVTADLYGLDRRPEAEILDGDYYGLTGTPDPDAMLLQEDFLVSDMDLNALFFSKSGGNQNLLDFLNEQYAGGEGAGDYVFLRINTTEDSNQRWVLASGNSEDESRRPQLRYQALEGEPFLIGDFDRDGDIDIDDVDFYSGQIGVTDNDAGFDPDLDLDKDDIISLTDHDLHITVLLEDANGSGAQIGDLNLDGDVDVSEIQFVDGVVVNNGDASRLLANLGNTSGMRYADGDLNGDGDVDVSQIQIINGQVVNVGDASRLLANLGQATASAATTSAVPEPGCMAILTIAGIGAIARRRRQQP